MDLDLDLDGVTFIGPSLSEETERQLLDLLPPSLASILRTINGFVALGGAIHLRGICQEPAWHSLALVWRGEYALSTLFKNITPDDIPFAEDYLGNQFFLRGDEVYKLTGETGDIANVGLDIAQFLADIAHGGPNIVEMDILQKYWDSGHDLQPGYLLNIYPPLCTAESQRHIQVAAAPALEEIRYLSDVARQISRLPPGTRFRIKIQ